MNETEYQEALNLLREGLTTGILKPEEVLRRMGDILYEGFSIAGGDICQLLIKQLK